MLSKRMLIGCAIAVTTAGCGVLPAAPGTRDEQNPPPYVNVVRSDTIHIQLVPQKVDGAPPNQHPAAFQPAQIQALLTSLRLRSPNDQVVTLASSSRMGDLARGLSKALARAGVRQDVAFVVFRRVAEGPLFGSARRVTSGRMFYRDDTLNVIFGALDAKVDPFRDLTVKDFKYGSRAGTSAATTDALVQTDTWHYHSQRRDWIEMPATRQAIAAAGDAAPEVIETSEGQAASSFDYGPAAAPGDERGGAGASSAATDTGGGPMNGPAAQPEPSRTAPAPAQAMPAAAPAVSGKRGWARIEDRLTQLKRLRQKNLITEKDYQNKKEELLQELP